MAELKALPVTRIDFYNGQVETVYDPDNQLPRVVVTRICKNMTIHHDRQIRNLRENDQVSFKLLPIEDALGRVQVMATILLDDLPIWFQALRPGYFPNSKTREIINYYRQNCTATLKKYFKENMTSAIAQSDAMSGWAEDSSAHPAAHPDVTSDVVTPSEVKANQDQLATYQTNELARHERQLVLLREFDEITAQSIAETKALVLATPVQIETAMDKVKGEFSTKIEISQNQTRNEMYLWRDAIVEAINLTIEQSIEPIRKSVESLTVSVDALHKEKEDAILARSADSSDRQFLSRRVNEIGNASHEALVSSQEAHRKIDEYKMYVENGKTYFRVSAYIDKLIKEELDIKRPARGTESVMGKELKKLSELRGYAVGKVTVDEKVPYDSVGIYHVTVLEEYFDVARLRAMKGIKLHSGSA